MKTCNKCKVSKPLDEFRIMEFRDKSHIRATCFSCEAEYRRKYRRDGRAPAYRRHHLTIKQYQALVDKRQGLCHNPNCSNLATDIDHDHSCCPNGYSCGNCVVGMLCRSCNWAEGMLESSISRTQGLVKYIESTRS